ncbi:MAG TPA: protein phosphatase 2C domain-containing protein [Ktedonobacteraceae bacterium]|nr:protein phosphatase 2C domain-containing protein [Ktedonobacteraceae bacterium]
MFADVTSLRYWKSERADITTCEDALRFDLQHGLFCVADGAGSTLFSNIWADILVEQFVKDPLMSSDPFEMEWWIRQAQKHYQERAPQSDRLNWNARRKALEQGAYSTLATLRFTRAERTAASAELLVVGDSCIITGNPQKQQITSFPLQHSQEFDRAPYCVPALPKNLNRYTLYARTWEVSFAPGDIIILATDAVARWIIGGGASGNESNSWLAFNEVAQKRERDWPEFIDACRANQSMVDDDSTAMIIALREDGREAERPGLPAAPRQETVAARRAEFERARNEDNKELVAITYGDGYMLNTASIILTDKEKTEAREVADALRNVLQAVRDALNMPNFTAKVEPVWWRYAHRLIDEPCAETIRKNLAAQGVRLKRPENVPLSALQSVDPVGGEQAPAPGIAGRPGESFQGSTAIELEQTRILAPVLPTPTSQQQDAARLQTFREALALGDPLTIVSAFDRSFESNLMAEEKTRLQAAQTKVQNLFSVLKEGTARQKVEAYEAVQRPVLDDKNREQLKLAQGLVEAMHGGQDDQISHAYGEIEFSPLRKHFIITPEEQKRIEQARQMRGATGQFRMILRSGTATPALLLQAYEKIQTPGSSLSVNERYMIDLSQRFFHSRQTVQQALQALDNARLEHFVRLYDALYYAPYRIVCTEDDARQVNIARKYVSPTVPTVMTVNGVPITISHVFAFFDVKRRYARFQLALLRQQHPAQPLERQYVEQSIVYWERELERGDWPLATLNELLEQRLLEQKIQEEVTRGNARHGNINLSKDSRRETDELARELRLEKDPGREIGELARVLQARGIDIQASIARITEQDWRNALAAIALKRLVERSLFPMPDGQTLSHWLDAQRNTSVIHYYEHPEKESPVTNDQRRCWLFMWWIIRERNLASL